MSKYNTKVKILVPIIDGQKKGDINHMKKNEAEKYQKEGLVKILEEPKKKATSSIKNSENKKKITSNDETPIKEKKSPQIPSKEKKETQIIEKDIKTFIDYLNLNNYWFNVFRPNINGERPSGSLLGNAFFKKKDRYKLIDRIKEYNSKGIVCLAINDRKEKDQTVNSIDKVHSLVIDIDVKKSFKKGFVSLPEHHEKAIETAYNVKDYLEQQNFKVSMIVDSGNGAQMYLYLSELFSNDFFEKRKIIQKEEKDSKKRDKQIKELFKEEELYRRIETFEKELKSRFNYDFIEIDNITKDINRRMKIPGTINKKDEEQVENRLSKIIYYKKDCHHDDRENIQALNNYEPTVIKSVVSEEKKTEIKQSDEKLNYRISKILESKKDKDKEFKKTFYAKNLEELFSGDRSKAEQSLVNSLFFRGFRTFEEVNSIMCKSNIGKWVESKDQYREITFEKAKTLFQMNQNEKKERKNSFESAFDKYTLYMLSDDYKTKYLVHNNISGKYTIKNGNDSLTDYLYITLQNDKVDLNELNLYYPDSNSKIKNILFDFIQDYNFIKCINDISFKPITDLEFEENGKFFYNSYRPTQYLSISSNEENIDLKKECSNIYYLLHNICGKEEGGVDYILKLLGFILQNPHIKTEKLVVLFGEEGAGKGIFFNNILKPLFEDYAIQVNQSTMDAPYNEYLSKKLIVYFNEVENKKENENVMKNYVTEKSLMINEKYGGMRQETSYFTIFADVNGNNPITAGERRTVYLKSKTLGGSFKKSDEIGELLALEIPKEITKFAQYLKNINVNHKEIRKGYETQAKKDVLDNVKTIEKEFIDLMKEYDSLENFIESLSDTTYDLQIGKYVLEGWIEVNFVLNCFNAFKLKKGFRNPTVLNKFSWIYDALGFDRSKEKGEVKRFYNTSGRKVYWLKLNKLRGLFYDDETEKNKEENKLLELLDLRESISHEDLKTELGMDQEQLNKLLEKLKKEGIIYEPRKNELRRVE